jgi:hypothetical protein
VPNLLISDLVERLRRLRDWARESGPNDIYIELVEACALCEALADPDNKWEKMVNVDDVAAQLRRQGPHLVVGDESKGPGS